MVSHEIAEFFEAGHSLHIGTRGADLQPSGTRAWAVEVSADRAHMTVFVMTAGAVALRRDLEGQPEVALTCGRVDDHVTWQAKGHCVEVRPARVAERERVTRQAETFRDHLATIGITRDLTAGWRYWPCIAVRFKVAELFNQTPGPGAGERVK
ncbi:MAG TPA: hypothetical protein VFV19_01915 [Candidatus Polarisedimenticolaceae bacterium]|nr:hypothetical protein [Candidatus Polarisedimenticolaceae bacterium]